MPHRLLVNGELMLYGRVGDNWDGSGFTAIEVVQALAEAETGPLTVRINSYGGLAMEGAAIYNALKGRGETTIFIDSIAASAASLIAMAGSEIVMREGSFMMIHDPAGITIGNAEAHEKVSKDLAKMSDEYARIYANRTGRDQQEVRDMMRAETLMSAQEAVDEKFADRVDGAKVKPKSKTGQSKASFDRAIFAAVMEHSFNRAILPTTQEPPMANKEPAAGGTKPAPEPTALAASDPPADPPVADAVAPPPQQPFAWTLGDMKKVQARAEAFGLDASAAMDAMASTTSLEAATDHLQTVKAKKTPAMLNNKTVPQDGETHGSRLKATAQAKYGVK
jgi:ATP-dependent protease ClpP protease subunit